MALVAYGSDISDSEDEDTQNNTEIVNSGSTKLVLPAPKDTEKPALGLFNVLPTPKNDKWTADVPEEEDEFLLKKAVPLDELPPKPPQKLADRKPAKIMLPSLASFEDDEAGEVQPKFKRTVKGAGLLGMLPLPKTSADFLKTISSTKFVPNIITKAPVKPAVVKPVVKNTIPTISYESSDDSDDETKGDAIDFFSLNKKEEIIPLPADDVIEKPSEITDNVEFPHPNVQSTSFNYITDAIDLDPNSYINDDEDENLEDVEQQNEGHEVFYSNFHRAHQEALPVPEPVPVPVEAATIDDEALRILCGSNKRRKGEAMEFIDIDQKEILPDSREWLTKALTENSNKRGSSGKRKGNEPTNQQRRKHQITYLAHQAKANEHELQNQWANNRMTRKQTQSKYGF